MKQLLITIAAVVLVGCGPSVDIHKAVGTRNFQKVKEYLDSGSEVDVLNDRGETPLHYAATFGFKEVAQILINKGANIESKNIDGMTPLHLSAQSRNINVAELLITKGANVNAKNTGGMTPLHLAV